MTETTGQDPSPTNDTTLQIPTIAGKLDETSSNKTNGKKKVPRKILHFSDGVLEEYSTDEEEEEAIRMKEEEEKRRKEEDAEMSGWQEQPGSSPVQPRSDQPSPEETASTQPLADKLAHTKYESINDSVQN